MARRRMQRPTPIQIVPMRAKRQGAGLGAAGPGSAEEGPESPDSPGSSPSTTGAPSPDDSSDSEDDEPPSPITSTSTAASSIPKPSSTSSPPSLSTSSSQSTSTTLSPFSRPSSSSTSSQTSSSQTLSSSSTSKVSPAFTQTPTSRNIDAGAPPLVTSSSTVVDTTSPTSTTTPTSPISPTTSVSQFFSSKVARPTQLTTASVSASASPRPSFSGAPIAENDPPRRTRPEPTLMSKGAEAAAITLSIIGAIALVVSILLYCKRRRRRRNERLEAELERDAATHAALSLPQPTYSNDSTTRFAGSGPHMTQFSDRSNTLFGAASYSRPETVSTRDRSRIPMPQPTPNPFADPPLNKAYDVLAGRPRSTTLTDRGSWIKNPFQNPESERFDPFGELQAKARRERVKQVELARREAELERQFQEKEKMGLAPPRRVMERNGSGVTFEGMGVLDRSAEGAYR
ncbi:hypothetical protein OPT61_g1690 [Boeremia exigua]|uniref:Uncharacterized protein n=1 Tax=Boeremia exigua TaxID=749465 RepID=A0ACC2IP49_9PLEO|nr:hypothetical protein OPT61_g1690 [Boeremia exigua]